MFLLKKLHVICLLYVSLYFLLFPINRISKSSMEIYGNLLSIGSFISDNIIEKTTSLCSRFLYFHYLESDHIKFKKNADRIGELKGVITKLLAENKELRNLLKVTDRLKYNTTTSKLIGINITPFSSSALINAGKKNHIKINNWVRNQNGLIGKIINVSNNYSSVMLLNDPKSRVPVITSFSRERGILAKKGSNMLLIYLSSNHNVKVNESLYTSGDGEIYPYGILVGKIHKINGDSVFVKLTASIDNLDYVIIESIYNENCSIL